MIEIKINLVPFGVRDMEKQIGLVKIWNDGTGTSEIGNYKYKMCDEDGQVILIGSYKGFPHEDRNIFYLLQEILNKELV